MPTLIRHAARPEEAAAAWPRIEEMSRWDVTQAAALGLPGEEVLAAYYPERSPDALAERYAAPAALFVAWDGDRPSGLIAHAPVDARTTETEKFYVAPHARGTGLGRRLMATLLASLRPQPFDRIRLETATFMADAIRFYQVSGFVRCPPFRPAPKPLDAVAVFMARDLPLDHERLPGDTADTDP